MVSWHCEHTFCILNLTRHSFPPRLDANADADSEELKARKKKLEETVTPIISKLYAGAGGDAGQPPAEEDASSKDEL